MMRFILCVTLATQLEFLAPEEWTNEPKDDYEEVIFDSLPSSTPEPARDTEAR